jgi:hypothetical protein
MEIDNLAFDSIALAAMLGAAHQSSGRWKLNNRGIVAGPLGGAYGDGSTGGGSGGSCGGRCGSAQHDQECRAVRVASVLLSQGQLSGRLQAKPRVQIGPLNT